MPMRPAAKHTSAADTTAAVEALMASLSHPLKAELLALRRAILEAHPSIREGVKWNAPSFRTHEYFATLHLREKAGFSVILHLGAKPRDRDAPAVRAEDPTGLLEWLAADRARVSFADLRDLEARGAAFAALIRAWIAHL